MMRVSGGDLWAVRTAIAAQAPALIPAAARQARRHAGDVLRTDEAMHKLFDVLARRYEERVGGYTRILRCRSPPPHTHPHTPPHTHAGPRRRTGLR